jgi:hypothetical protein
MDAVSRWQQLRKEWLGSTGDVATRGTTGRGRRGGAAGGGGGGAAAAAAPAHPDAATAAAPGGLPADAAAAARLLAGCCAAAAAAQAAERAAAADLFSLALAGASGARAAPVSGAADCGRAPARQPRADQTAPPTASWRAQLCAETDACLQTLRATGHAACRAAAAAGHASAAAAWDAQRRAAPALLAAAPLPALSGRCLAHAAAELEGALCVARLAAEPLARTGLRAAHVEPATTAAAAAAVASGGVHRDGSGRRAPADDTAVQADGGGRDSPDAGELQLADKLRLLHARRGATRQLRAWRAAAAGAAARDAAAVAAALAGRRRRTLRAWQGACPGADPEAVRAAAVRWRIAGEFRRLYCQHACLAAWRQCAREAAETAAAAAARERALKAQRLQEQQVCSSVVGSEAAWGLALRGRRLGKLRNSLVFHCLACVRALCRRTSCMPRPPPASVAPS